MKHGEKIAKNFFDSSIAICYASRYGHADMIEFLLRTNTITLTGAELIVACQHRRIDAVKVLLKYPKCDPTKNNYAVLKIAEMCPELLDIILDHPLMSRMKTLIGHKLIGEIPFLQKKQESVIK